MLQPQRILNKQQKPQRRGSRMPNVKGKKFPYTAAGKKAAAAYAAKPSVKKKPMKKPMKKTMSKFGY